MSKDITLVITTPQSKSIEVKCDSVKLTVSDGKKGKHGGSYGIRHGHTKALFALSDGTLTATLGGNTVYSAKISGGFATVDNNKVTVVTDAATTL